MTLLCVTMNSSKTQWEREAGFKQGRDRERESAERKVTVRKFLCSMVIIRNGIDHLRNYCKNSPWITSVLSHTSCKRCLINTYANEIRCAFKDGPSDFTLAANLTCFSSMIILSLSWPSWSIYPCELRFTVRHTPRLQASCSSGMSEKKKWTDKK